MKIKRTDLYPTFRKGTDLLRATCVPESYLLKILTVLIKSKILFKQPLQRNILEGSVRQRSSDGDWQDAAFEFLQGNVNRI